MDKPFSLSNSLAIRFQTEFIFSIVIGLSVLTSCATGNSPSLSPLAEKYLPIRLANNVQTQPGSLAWSKDGKTLAFINNSVTLYDVESREQKKLPIEDPHFLNWSPDNTLFTLSRKEGKDALCAIDRDNLVVTRTGLDKGFEAIYATTDTQQLLLLSKDIKEFSYGTEVALRVLSYDRSGDKSKFLYGINKTYQVKNLNLRHLLAWTHTGANPVDNSLLAIEYIKAPVLSLYSHVVVIDPVTGRDTDIFDETKQSVYASAGWSPDGRMVALTDRSGHLSIRTINGDEFVLDPSTAGVYPSWSPQGHRIYNGGFLIYLDGKPEETLLTNSFWSIAQWSPDGTKLAVASGGDLWLFNDVGSPSMPNMENFVSSRAKEIARLQELFREGLITAMEYDVAHVHIMRGPDKKR